jgi:hypothetical protein
MMPNSWQVGFCHFCTSVHVTVGSVRLFFFFCRAWWLMPPDVPQPVRLIVLNLL